MLIFEFEHMLLSKYNHMKVYSLKFFDFLKMGGEILNLKSKTVGDIDFFKMLEKSLLLHCTNGSHEEIYVYTAKLLLKTFLTKNHCRQGNIFNIQDIN